MRRKSGGRFMFALSKKESVVGIAGGLLLVAVVGLAVTAGGWLLNVWFIVKTAKWMGWL